MSEFIAAISGFILGVLGHKHVWDWGLAQFPPYLQDKRLFEDMKQLLNRSNGLHFLEQHDFSASFRRVELQPMQDLAYLWNTPDYMFLDRKIEKQKRELVGLADKFLIICAQNTVVMREDETRLHLGPDGPNVDETRRRQEAQEINKAALDLYNGYILFHQMVSLRLKRLG